MSDTSNPPQSDTTSNSDIDEIINCLTGYYWQEDKYVSGSNYDYTKAETAKYVHKVIAQEANKTRLDCKQELIEDLEEAIMMPGRKANWLKAWLKDEQQKITQLKAHNRSNDDA